ncbi:PTS sugar transporter subunit IIA [Lacticaseibacillus paracasei]|uniref:PTS sugar transporter subunit IIA n=1 Tax=Lacticaseibacillus paracasei TaxID=1597 RepID=UPI0030EB51FB
MKDKGGIFLRNKNKIILLTHKGWGGGLIKSMGMLVGKTINVIDIPLMPSETLVNYISLVKESSKDVNENTLVLTDIPGGTTSNVALRLTREYPWKIISGVNALMLVEAIMHQDEDLSLNVLDKILSAGKNSQNILELQQKTNEE